MADESKAIRVTGLWIQRDGNENFINATGLVSKTMRAVIVKNTRRQTSKDPDLVLLIEPVEKKKREDEGSDDDSMPF